MEGYKTIVTTPEFHFDTEWHFEMTEESRKELDDLMRQHDEDAVHFFSVFEWDLMCCIERKCEYCHMNGTAGCQKVLQGNIHRMIDNQKRMMIEFNRRRNEKLG